MHIIDKLTSFIAPHRCLSCRNDGSLVCFACGESNLTPKPSVCYRCNKLMDDYRTCKTCRAHSDIFRAFVGYDYEELSLELIRALKFKRARDGARLVARHINNRLPLFECDIVTHIPTASKRVRQRGYDQSKLIAKELSGIKNIPHQTLLSRVDQSRQVGKRIKDRQAQAQTAFRTKRQLSGEHILLVDDVMASGSTLEAAAKLIKQSGAKRVDVAVFARS